MWFKVVIFIGLANPTVQQGVVSFSGVILALPNYDSAYDPVYRDKNNGWIELGAQEGSNSFLEVHHNLGVLPIKVQVWVMTTNGSVNDGYLFEGMGSGQRDDDDFNYDYGGVVYTYNRTVVKIWAPDKNNQARRGYMVSLGHPGWTGPNNATVLRALVRVRLWKACNFPRPSYVSSWISISSGNGDASFKQIPHSVGSYPDLVIVQARSKGLDTEFFFDGMGATMSDELQRNDNAYGGVIYAYNQNNVRIWVPTGRNGYAGIIRDGWGGEVDSFALTDIDIRVSVWKSLGIPQFSTDFIVNESPSSPTSVTLSTNNFISVFTAIMNVRTQALSGANAGYIFPGLGGTQSHGQSGSTYGGLIFGVSSSYIRLWRPSGSSGYVINVGGGWGNGKYEQHTREAKVLISVFGTYAFILDNPCQHGGICSETESGYGCNCTDTGFIGEFCEIDVNECISSPCLNGGKCLNAFKNWTCDCSQTCFTGPTCNVSKNCGNVPAVGNATYTVATDSQTCDATATYTCLLGYTWDNMTTTGKTASCSKLNWTEPVPGCRIVNCGDPGHIRHSSHKGSHNYGDVVNYTCNTFFARKSGDYSKICTATGNWAGTPLVCAIPVYPGQVFGFLVVAIAILCLIIIPIDIVWYCRKRARSREATKRIYHYDPDTATSPKPTTYILDDGAREYIYYLIYHNIPYQQNVVEEANKEMRRKSHRHAWTTVMTAPSQEPLPAPPLPKPRSPSPPVREELEPRLFRTAHMSVAEDKVPILYKMESESATDIEITNIRESHFVGTDEFIASRSLTSPTKTQKKKGKKYLSKKRVKRMPKQGHTNSVTVHIPMDESATRTQMD